MVIWTILRFRFSYGILFFLVFPFTEFRPHRRRHQRRRRRRRHRARCVFVVCSLSIVYILFSPIVCMFTMACYAILLFGGGYVGATLTLSILLLSSTASVVPVCLCIISVYSLPTRTWKIV